MEQAQKNKIKVGFFITISILFFVLAIYYIGKKQQLFNNTFRISGVFKDVSGLQVGNNVRFLGINVGIIESIELITDSTVLVKMEINNDTRLFMKKNAKALVGSDGLMGNKIMLIIPSSPNAISIENNDYIATSQPVNIDDIMQQLHTTATNSANITSDLAIISKNIREGKGAIGKLIMDENMADNVDKSLVNIKEGAGSFKQNMDAVGHSVFLKRYLKRKNKKSKE